MYPVFFVVDELMENHQNSNFQHQFHYYSGDSYFCTRQNLMFRLTENPACTQTTLGDNSSLRAHDSIEQSKDASVLGKIARTNFNI